MSEAAPTGPLPIAHPRPALASLLGLSSMVRFWGCCLPHLVVAPVAFLGVTFLHELAHAAAVLVLGGEVTGFTFVPGPGALGQTFWRPGLGWGPLESDLVSVAPYLLWAGIAGTTLAVATLPNRLHWLVGSALFLWGFAAPVGDVAWNLSAPAGDLAVPGVEGGLVLAAGSLAVLVAYVLGFWVQRRLLPGAALTPAGYLASTVVLGASFAVAGMLTLAVFGA